MSLAKKSTKWLVALFVIFALVLTAAFAAGNVARASAEPLETAEDTTAPSTVIVEVTDSAGNVYPDLANIENVTRTLTVKYYVEIPGDAGAYSYLKLSPVLVYADTTHVAKPNTITINSALATYADLEYVTEYLADNATAFSVSMKTGATISDLNGVDSNGDAISNKYLFTATYELDYEEEEDVVGAYELTFADDPEDDDDGSEIAPADEGVTYIPAIENGEFTINDYVDYPVISTTSFVYNGSEQAVYSGSNAGYTYSGAAATVVGEYTATFELNDYYIWRGGNAQDGYTYSLEDYEVDWEITKMQIAIPEEDDTDFVFTGSAQSYNVAASDYYTVTGTPQTNAGEYEITISLDDTDNTEWSDGTTEDIVYDFVIAKVQITKPTPYGNNQYVYDSYNKQFMLDVVSAETGYYTISNNIRRNAGSQTVTVSLKDKTNTEWADGTTTDLAFTLTVQPRPVNLSVSADAASHVYGDTPANVSISATGIIDAFTCSYKVVCVDGEEPYAEYNPTQFNAGLNVGHYTLNAIYNDINGNYDVTVAEPFAYEITTRYITVPTAISNLVYTGEAQDGVDVHGETAFIELYSGSASATNAGNYTAVYELTDNNNTEWEGTNEDTVSINWSIAKAQIEKPSISASYKTYNGESQSYSGSGTGYTFTGSGTNAGSYPVTVTLSDKDNTQWNDNTSEDYNAADKLVINKKTVTLSFNDNGQGYSSVYGADLATIEVTATGLVGNDTLGTLGYSVTKNNAAATLVNAGTYTLTTTYTENANYTVTPDTATYTITPKAVTIAFSKSNYTSVYGESLEEISLAATGLVNEGDLGTISYVVMQNEQFVELVNVGVYSLVNTYSYNSNYQVTQGAYATYTITTKQIVKPAQDNTTFTYNGNAQTYNVAASDDYTITGTTSKTNAGSNSITIALNDKANTEWTTGGTADVVYTFTIAQKAVTLDFYDSDDEEPWHLTFVATYPDSMYYITVKATGLIGANDLGELGFIATNDETHAVADITVAGAPAGYYTLTPTYTPNANYDVTALQGTARIYELYVPVPVVVTDTYDYDGTAKAIVFDEVTSQGYSQYYTITGNSLTEFGTTTVTVAFKDEYAGNVIWGYDERVDEFINTTDDQTFTLTVNSPLITVTFTYSYGEDVTTIEEDVEVNSVNDAMRALPVFRWFKTAGWRVNGEGDVVTAYTLAMDGQTLNAEFTYNVGAGDANGDGVISSADVILLKRWSVGLDRAKKIADAAAAWAKKDDTSVTSAVLYTALDANNSGKFNSSDIVATREALATGYNFKVVVSQGIIQVMKVNRVEVDNYEDLIDNIRIGNAVTMTADITAATTEFDEDLDIPVDIDLGNYKLTVLDFKLNTNTAGATLKVTNGTLYTVTGITVTAPNGNVVVADVNGYSYDGTVVNLAAYSESLHIEDDVAFYIYKAQVEENVDYDDVDHFKAALTEAAEPAQMINELSAIRIEETEARMADIATIKADTTKDEAQKAEEINALDVKKAIIEVPVDTHVVVEAAANLSADKVVVKAQSDATAPAVTTFSIEVKNAEAEVVTVDISEVKETIETVDYYVVEEVAITGNTAQVEVVSGDNTAAQVKKYVAQIGTTGYETLQAAITAAQNADTIKLLANVPNGTGIMIPDHTVKSITIDFGGFTYTVDGAGVGSTGTETQAMHWSEGSTVTLKNGSFVISVNGATVPNPANNKIIKMAMQNYANLTVKNMTMDFSNIVVRNYGTYTGKDAPYSGLEIPLFNLNAGSMTIENTTITFPNDSTKGILIEIPDAATIKNSTINGYVSLGQADANVTIVDSTVTGVVSYFAANAVVQEGNVYSLLLNTAIVVNETQLKNAVAANIGNIIVGDDFSLASTIYVSGGKDIVIDMNGYSITSTNLTLFAVYAGNSLEFTGNGNLTLNNAAKPNRAAMWIEGSTNVASVRESYLTLGEGVTLTSTGYGLVLYEVTGTNYCYGVVISVDGTITTSRNAAICAIGNIGQHDGDVVNGDPIASISEINIGSTANLSAVNSAIYAAGFAVWNIESGAQLTGADAIYAKSGYLTIGDGVVLTATKNPASPYEYYGNGELPTGDGIVIDSCNYPGKAPVVNYTAALLDNITVTAEGAQKVGIYWAVANETELNEAIAAKAPYIYLRNDFTISETIVVDYETVLNMNGKTLYNVDDLWEKKVGDWSIISVREDGDLTIIGDGTISAKENDCYAIDVQDGATLDIEDGTYIGNVSVVYICGGGHVTINGGEYSLLQLWPDERYLLNCLDADYKAGTANFTVTGGTFHGFNPADNASEGANTNYLADGYVAVEDNGVWTVVPNEITITTFAQLKAAIADVNAGNIVYPTLIIANDIQFEEELTISKSVYIMGDGEVKFIGYDASTKYDEAFYINVADEDQEITIDGIVFDHFCYYSNVANKTKATASAVKNGVAYITYGGDCPASTTLYVTGCRFLGTARDMINASSTKGCKGFIVIEDCYFDATDRLSSTLNMLSFYGNADAELYVMITGCTFKEASEQNATWATSAIASFGNADITVVGCEFIACQIGIAIDNTFDRLYSTSTYPVYYNTTVNLVENTYTNCYFGYYGEFFVEDASEIPEEAELYTDEPFTYGDAEATQFHFAAEYDVVVGGTQGVDAKYLTLVCYYVKA